jgi:hypothetical protein
VPSAALTHGPVGLLCKYPGQVVLETNSKARPLLVAWLDLLLRRDLPLRRDYLLLLLFWLHLRRMGAAVRYIVPQRRSQLLAVVGEDLRVVCAAQNSPSHSFRDVLITVAALQRR